MKEGPTSVADVQGERPIEDLLAAGIDGDADAWAELVRRLSPAIWAVVASHRLSRAEAEDLAQTVWLRLLDRHHTIRDPSRLAGWIKTIARNEANTMKRGTSRVEPRDEIEESTSAEASPEAGLDERTTNQMLVAGLNKLDDDCQVLLRMLAHKVAYKDVAVHFGWSIGSIGESRRRCLDKLRATREGMALQETRRP